MPNDRSNLSTRMTLFVSWFVLFTTTVKSTALCFQPLSIRRSHPSLFQPSWQPPRRHRCCLFAKRDKRLVNELKQHLESDQTQTNPQNSLQVETQQTEFSRFIRIDSVLSGTRTEYSTSVEARSEEREALATRFKYIGIPRLKADITLAKDAKMGSGRASGSEVVRVDGEVDCTLTRTCVRTLENFDENLQFSFIAAVRTVGYRDDAGRMNVSEPSKQRRQKKQIDLSSLDSEGLQGIIDEVQEEREDVIEDPEIYGEDGQLDVGELVAQYISLKADPNPKKPGTELIVQTWTF